MEYWWIYLLTFLFGYITHKTFYFLRSARLSLSLIKASHIIYLSLLIKAIENFAYTKTLTMQQMKETDKSREQIRKFEYRHDEDVALFKARSIAVLLEYHPPFFRVRFIEPFGFFHLTNIIFPRISFPKTTPQTVSPLLSPM